MQGDLRQWRVIGVITCHLMRPGCRRGSKKCKWMSSIKIISLVEHTLRYISGIKGQGHKKINQWENKCGVLHLLDMEKCVDTHHYTPMHYCILCTYCAVHVLYVQWLTPTQYRLTCRGGNLYVIPKQHTCRRTPVNALLFPTLPPHPPSLSPHTPDENASLTILSSYPWLCHLLPFLSSVILDYFYILSSQCLSYCVFFSLPHQLRKRKIKEEPEIACSRCISLTNALWMLQ